MKKALTLLILIGIITVGVGCTSADPMTDATYNLKGYYYYDGSQWVNTNNHGSAHENGGSDEIDVTGLSGLLADNQTPSAHASIHEYGGSDEITLYSLLKQPVYIYATNGNWYTTFPSGGASADQLPTRLALYTGATTNTSGIAYTMPTGLSAADQEINWDSDYSYYCKIVIVHNDPTNQESWISFAYQQPLSLGDLTVRGIGINVKGASRRLYICSNDGVTYSETDTSIDLSNYNVYSLEMIYTHSTSIVVKINGVTAGIKTTNLPSGTGGDSRWGIMHQRSGGSAVDEWDGIRISKPIIYGGF